MPISVVCQCGKRLVAKDELAGKSLRCPACAQVVVVPLAAASAPAKSTSPGPARQSGKWPGPLLMGFIIGAMLSTCCFGFGVGGSFLLVRRYLPDVESMKQDLADARSSGADAKPESGKTPPSARTASPEQALIGKWKLDVEAIKKNPPPGVTDETLMMVEKMADTFGSEFKSDGTMTLNDGFSQKNSKWKLLSSAGNKLTVEVIMEGGKRGTEISEITVIDNDHIVVSSKDGASPTFYFKRSQ
jgi:hypothetical protein